jgi:hypothetical protein
MTEQNGGRPADASRYEIRLGGHLESRWAAWFDGMTLTRADDGTTVLTGPVVDQAALHGLLRKVRDLGLPLLSVTQIDPSQAHASTSSPRQPRKEAT